MDKSEIKETLKELFKSGEIKITLENTPNPFGSDGVRLKVIIDNEVIAKAEADS